MLYSSIWVYYFPIVNGSSLDICEFAIIWPEIQPTSLANLIVIG